MLDFYRRPATMTSGGEHARMLDTVPRDLAGMTRVVQGLLLHEHWAPAYGVTLSAERKGQSHIRPASLMLDRLLSGDGRPLSVARPVDARLVGVCRHFTVLLVAMLRGKGFPPAPVAGSALTSIPRTSRTTGSASTGMTQRGAGFSSTRRSTTCNGQR